MGLDIMSVSVNRLLSVHLSPFFIVTKCYVWGWRIRREGFVEVELQAAGLASLPHAQQIRTGCRFCTEDV